VHWPAHTPARARIVDPGDIVCDIVCDIAWVGPPSPAGRTGQQCQLANYSWAGLEASHQCCCGRGPPPASKAVPAAQCNEPCTGDHAEQCGASYRLWAYNASSVGPPPPQPASPTADARHIANGRVSRF
jgi:hypothetical protein